jgi:hypothetical protein
MFGASVLNIPFRFYTLVHQSPEFMKDPEISPRGSDLRAFQITLDTVFQNFVVSKSRTPEGSTLAWVDVLDEMKKKFGS